MRTLIISALILLSTHTLASDCDEITRKAAFHADQMTAEDKEVLLNCTDESDSEVDGYGFANTEDMQKSVDSNSTERSIMETDAVTQRSSDYITNSFRFSATRLVKRR